MLFEGSSPSLWSAGQATDAQGPSNKRLKLTAPLGAAQVRRGRLALAIRRAPAPQLKRGVGPTGDAILRCAVFVIGVGISMAGCASAGRTRSLKPIPKCEASSTNRPSADWQRIELGDGFAFLLPSSCALDPETQFVHGGRRWRCGTIGVDVVWGMWGAGSFSDHEQQCKTTEILSSVVDRAIG